jgi:hypothetical protein
MTLGWELVVLHPTLFMFSTSLVCVWKMCGGLKKGHFILTHINGQTHYGHMPRAQLYFSIVVINALSQQDMR